MYLSSPNRAPDGSRQPASEKWSLALKWMESADQRDLEGSIMSLTDAFNSIEESVASMAESGIDPRHFELNFETARRMSSDFQTIYNECDYLISNHSARFNADLLYLLRELRNLCAHRFGSSMDRSMFMPIAVECILPMKESVRSSLYDVLDRNPGTGLRRLKALASGSRLPEPSFLMVLIPDGYVCRDKNDVWVVPVDCLGP